MYKYTVWALNTEFNIFQWLEVHLKYSILSSKHLTCLHRFLDRFHKVNVDLDECESLEDIIRIAINNLSNLLGRNNLKVLQEKLQELHYHIHDYSFVDILMSQPTYSDEPQFYICSHRDIQNDSKQ